MPLPGAYAFFSKPLLSFSMRLLIGYADDVGGVDRHRPARAIHVNSARRCDDPIEPRHLPFRAVAAVVDDRVDFRNVE